MRILLLLFTHGTADLLGLIARPVTNNGIPAPMSLVLEHVEGKGWCNRWPSLRVLPPKAVGPTFIVPRRISSKSGA